MIDRHGNPIPSAIDVTPQRARNAFAFRHAFGSRAHAAILAAPGDHQHREQLRDVVRFPTLEREAVKWRKASAEIGGHAWSSSTPRARSARSSRFTGAFTDASDASPNKGRPASARWSSDPPGALSYGARRDVLADPFMDSQLLLYMKRVVEQGKGARLPPRPVDTSSPRRRAQLRSDALLAAASHSAPTTRPGSSRAPSARPAMLAGALPPRPASSLPGRYHALHDAVGPPAPTPPRPEPPPPRARSARAGDGRDTSGAIELERGRGRCTSSSATFCLSRACASLICSGSGMRTALGQ